MRENLFAKPRDPEPDEARFAFIPAHLLARCADCWGAFNLMARKCPGCGSKHYQTNREGRAA